MSRRPTWTTGRIRKVFYPSAVTSWTGLWWCWSCGYSYSRWKTGEVATTLKRRRPQRKTSSLTKRETRPPSPPWSWNRWSVWSRWRPSKKKPDCRRRCFCARNGTAEVFCCSRMGNHPAADFGIGSEVVVDSIVAAVVDGSRAVRIVAHRMTVVVAVDLQQRSPKKKKTKTVSDHPLGVVLVWRWTDTAMGRYYRHRSRTVATLKRKYEARKSSTTRYQTPSCCCPGEALSWFLQYP